MSEILKVYAYNVLFGDAVLLEIPEASGRRWVLFDVGNVLQGSAGDDAPLVAAVRDIHARTGGQVDLYVMTHEHLDHVQGLPAAERAGVSLRAKHVWMTASAAPNYYRDFPNARQKKRALEDGLEGLRAVLGQDDVTRGLEILFTLNLNASRTAECVEHLRGIGTHAPAYLYRDSPLGANPFSETTVRILAPEQDTSVYYASRPSFALAAGGGGRASAGRPTPLPGVDAGAFYDLVEQMDRGFADSAFQIDQAANNTSLVIELTWRGRRLLFVGDAERKSWRTMAAQPGLLRAVDFLKVGHHGSHNSTPPPAILDLFLPADRRDQAVALVCTCAGTYDGVPDDATRLEIERRVKRLYSTEGLAHGQPLVIEIPAART